MTSPSLLRVMDIVIIILYLFAFLALTQSFVCNYTIVDEDDPTTIQLAQLDAIKCQIAAAAKQHSETLAAISSIQHHADSVNVSSVLYYLFLSLIFTFMIQQICKTIWCLLVLKNDKFARMVVSGRRCVHLDFNPISSHDIQMYRENLDIPCILMTYKCCLRPNTQDGSLEI